MSVDRIVSFYSGGSDDRGRTLDDILAWSDAQLESIHDYIQWVFPTAVPSGVNPFAPLVTADTGAAFKSSPALRDRLRAALDRMLAFYGLRRDLDAQGKVQVAIDQAHFSARSENWLRPGNHNHLRLTRIMQSLCVLGLDAEAEALQRCLLYDVSQGPGRGRISRETIGFWNEARIPAR